MSAKEPIRILVLDFSFRLVRLELSVTVASKC